MEHTAKILVVAGDPTMRALLTGFLRNRGYNVCVAADGEQAPHLLQREGIHGGTADVGKTLGNALILIVHAEPPHPQPCTPPGNVFRQEGEYWTIAYAGTVFRLKDTKGLHYIAHLLRWPAKKFHVLDLVAVADARPAGLAVNRCGRIGKRPPVEHPLRVSQLGDAGPKLDLQAKRAYKRRLDDLRDALEEAQRCRDLERAARVQAEIQWIVTELAAAYGLDGRVRKTADGNERARKAVTNRIKDTLTKIQQVHPSLWQHLVNAIRTGAFCAYIPEQPTAWHF
jgi:CheY-like chemotaxis protein